MAKDKPLSALQREVLQAMGEGRSIGLEDDPAREQFPALWEWLSTIYVGRDRIKQPASLTLTLVPGGVNVRLMDRDLCCSVEVTCRFLADALTSINENLISQNPGIKNWGKKEPHLRQRKKQT
jgi:hypothetical protein